MRFSHRGSLALLAIGAICCMAGCGGGGGGASAGGASTLGVFVTDGVGNDFKQVWVTLFKIEAKTDTADYVTLFDDQAGKLINFSSLADTAQFLNSVSVPAGDYKHVRLTFGDHFSMVPVSGGTAVDVPVADDIGTLSAGQVQIVLTATTAAPSAQLSNLVVDFDLAATTLVGGKVRPSLKKGDDSKFQGEKKHAEMEGVARNVASDSFDLLHEAGRVLKVHTTDKTEVFSARTGAAVQLANGNKVEVKGDLDPASHEVTASSVKVIDNDPGDCVDCGPDPNTRAQAYGSVASVDSETAFTVTLDGVEHFKPAQDTVKIMTTQFTQYKWPQHGGANFSSLAATEKVVVVGTYDPATNTILARFVLIQPASN